MANVLQGLPPQWLGFLRDWDRSLRAANYPTTTRYNYLLAGAQLGRYLHDAADVSGSAGDPAQVTGGQLEEFQACTHVGAVVLDIDDDIAFAATAAVTGRRHHALDGDRHLASMSHAAGYIDLILLHWPRLAVNPHWLLRSCRSLLGTTGCVVVVVSVDAGQRMAHLSALTGAATTAGLHTVWHVAIVAPVTATYVAVTDKPRIRTERHRTGSPTAERGRREVATPHTDLLIFELQAGRDE